MKKLLLWCAIVNWLIGVGIFYLVLTGLHSLGKPVEKLAVIVVTSFVLSALILRKGTRTKRSAYPYLIPLISIGGVWMTYVVFEWAAEHPQIDFGGLSVWVGAVPLAVATAVIGGLGLGGIFLYHALFRSVNRGVRIYGDSR